MAKKKPNELNHHLEMDFDRDRFRADLEDPAWVARQDPKELNIMKRNLKMYESGYYKQEKGE